MMLLYMCKNGGAIADKIFDNMATQSLFKGNEEHMGKIRSKFKGGEIPQINALLMKEYHKFRASARD